METTRAGIAIYKINYKSDFILTVVCDVEWNTPFCIKFWTGEPSQAYYVGWTGHEYKNCKVVESDPSKLLVLFDDHHLPVGELKMQIVYHTTIEDFPNAIVDEVTNSMKVMAYIDGKNQKVALDFEGEEDAELQFELPAYANEAQRIANEEQRIANEQARIEAEQQRIDNEQTRQDNEAQRIAQETARVNEYAELKANAVAATNAANDAATLAAQKAQLAADKAALADAAATLAAQKAQLAADKAALADAAATLANQKAALAQQKAEYAQTQGGYAKAQGDYAKEQGEIAEEDHERAEADHTRAESDHATAGSDHTQAGTDHSTAVNDHTQSVTDHTQADTDHTRAESDHTQAASDHTQAGADHTRAESDHSTASADHTQAGQDHTRSESDHTRAESDHAAVELYIDSLGAFDISAYHATGGVLAKYADLTAALGTNGANIPEAIRKGGMSVKFVQTYDNKYVQFRYMGTVTTGSPNPFTDTANWQGVDDEPTAGSDNLVKSSGVKKATTDINNRTRAFLSDENNSFYITDLFGNVVAKISATGIETTALKVLKDNNLVDLLTLLSNKVTVVPGKGLSTNDFTDEDKTKLNGILTDDEKFCVVDAEGYVALEIDKYGGVNYNGKGSQGNLYYGKKAVIIGDSHSENRSKWMPRICENLGMTFMSELNSLLGCGNNVAQAYEMYLHPLRAQLQALIENDLNKEVDVIFIENVHYQPQGNSSAYPFRPSQMLLLGTYNMTAAEESAYFNEHSVELLNGISVASRQANTVLKSIINSKTRVISFAASAITNGSITLYIDGQDFTAQVTNGMSLSDVVDALFTWSFADYCDWENISKTSNSITIMYRGSEDGSISFNVTSDCGVSATVGELTTNSSGIYRYFASDNLTNWADKTYWINLTSKFGRGWMKLKGLYEDIQYNYPNAQVIVLGLPDIRFSNSDIPDGKFDWYTFMQSNEYTFAEEIKETLLDSAKMYNIKTIDVEKLSGVTPFNWFTYYNENNVHPKDVGYQHWADVVIKELT